MKKTLVWLMLCCATLLQSAVVNSPDGRISVTIDIKEKLEPYPVGQRLYYAVEKDGQALLLDSPFRLDFKNKPPIADRKSVV